MKKFNLLMSVFLMSLLIFVSCDEIEDECFSLEEINVFDVTLSSDTIFLNESVEIEIGVNILNGCGDYHSTIISEDGNTLNVTANAIYEGCVCTEAIEYKRGTTTYTPTSTGIKILEFEQENNGILRDTLVVQ